MFVKSHIQYKNPSDSEWKQFPELRILYICAGEGIVIAGESATRFVAGDFYVIQPNTPHLCLSLTDAPFHVVSHLIDTDLYDTLIKDYGCFDINILAQEQSFKMKALHTEALRASFMAATLAKGTQQFIYIIEGLSKMATIREMVLLSKKLHSPISDKDRKRLCDAFRLLLNDYQRQIPQEEIASLCELSTANFSRFFKNYTKQTYVHFLNEIRIEAACRLLHHDNRNINEVAQLSGFNNLSHFNKSFKNTVGIPPSAYGKN